MTDKDTDPYEVRFRMSEIYSERWTMRDAARLREILNGKRRKERTHGKHRTVGATI